MSYVVSGNNSIINTVNVSYIAIAIPVTGYPNPLPLDWNTSITTNPYTVCSIMDITPTSAGQSILLPNCTQTSVGQTFLIRNVSTTNSFKIYQNDGVTVLATITTSNLAFFYLSNNTTANGSWVQSTFGSSSTFGISSLGINVTDSNNNLVVTSSNTNPLTTSGTFTFSYGADLAALLGFTSSGFPYRTSLGNWSLYTVQAGSNILINQPSGSVEPLSISLNQILTGLTEVQIGDIQIANSGRLSDNGTITIYNSSGPSNANLILSTFYSSTAPLIVGIGKNAIILSPVNYALSQNTIPVTSSTNPAIQAYSPLQMVGSSGIYFYDTTPSTTSGAPFYVGISAPTNYSSANYNLILPIGRPSQGSVMSVNSTSNPYQLTWTNVPTVPTTTTLNALAYFSNATGTLASSYIVTNNTGAGSDNLQGLANLSSLTLGLTGGVTTNPVLIQAGSGVNKGGINISASAIQGEIQAQIPISLVNNVPLKFYQGSNSSNYASIQSPTAFTSSYNFILPSGMPSSTGLLLTAQNISGSNITLGWSAAETTSIPSVTNAIATYSNTGGAIQSSPVIINSGATPSVTLNTTNTSLLIAATGTGVVQFSPSIAFQIGTSAYYLGLQTVSGTPSSGYNIALPNAIGTVGQVLGIQSIASSTANMGWLNAATIPSSPTNTGIVTYSSGTGNLVVSSTAKVDASGNLIATSLSSSNIQIDLTSISGSANNSIYDANALTIKSGGNITLNPTSQVLNAVGSASNPSYSFTGQTGYGMYYDSTNTALGLAAVGNQVVALKNSGASVNYLQITNALTTTAPSLTLVGSDTNIGLQIIPKGTGQLLNASGAVATPSYSFSSFNQAGMWTTGNSSLNFSANSLLAFQINGVSSAVNYLTTTNAVTGSGPVITSAGADTNVGLNVNLKGSATATLTSLTASSTTTLQLGTTGTSSGQITLQNSTASSPTITLSEAATSGNGILKVTGGLATSPVSASSTTTNSSVAINLAGTPSTRTTISGTNVTNNNGVYFTASSTNNALLTVFLNITAAANPANISYGVSSSVPTTATPVFAVNVGNPTTAFIMPVSVYVPAGYYFVIFNQSGAAISMGGFYSIV